MALLEPYEPKLLSLLTTVNGYSGHIALALGNEIASWQDRSFVGAWRWISV